MNRREVMVGGAALLGTGAVGGVSVLGSDGGLRALIEDIVIRHLPGARIDRAGLAQYSADRMQEIGRSVNYRVYAACLSLGADVSLLSASLRAKAEAFERKTVSDFLLRSNFFYVGDPAAETVIYEGEGPGACRNPFAVLD